MVTHQEDASIAQIIKSAVDAVVANFRPLKIVLFGSHARGQATMDSDLDFLIVMPDGTDRRGAAIQIHRQLRDLAMPKDVVVTTPAEITRRGDSGATVLSTALREGKVLYERR